jgi:anaerobic selenocysteine-containing dehydrogenase
MHAALSIPAVTGAWQYEGGGAFHSTIPGSSSSTKPCSKASTSIDPRRALSRPVAHRPVLTGDAEALRSTAARPVKAMLIQNTNPANDGGARAGGWCVKGFARDDLFVAVHEQFMTETAKIADVVLPATMFIEHDDLYKGGGHQHITLGPKLIDPPGRVPLQSRGDAGPRPPAQRRASGLRHDEAREGAPTVMIHPDDAAGLSIADGDAVTLGNMRGETTLTAKLFDGVRRGVLIAESIHPNKSHIGGRGINMLTGAEAVAPVGGAAFHDNKVWIRKAPAAA